MLLKYFYDEALAHASYLVGCQRTGEAFVIDPARTITPYLEAAAAEKLTITGCVETHIHADYVSGSCELAKQTEATIYLSDEGPADWKYEFGPEYSVQRLKEGDRIAIGKIQLTTMHTPGHTPESISLLLTDFGSGANEPMGIFTGDFIFVGAVGRPICWKKLQESPALLTRERVNCFGQSKNSIHCRTIFKSGQPMEQEVLVAKG